MPQGVLAVTAEARTALFERSTHGRGGWAGMLAESREPFTHLLREPCDDGDGLVIAPLRDR